MGPVDPVPREYRSASGEPETARSPKDVRKHKQGCDMWGHPTCQLTPTRGYQGTVLIHGSIGTGAFSNSPALYAPLNVPPDPHGSTSPCYGPPLTDPNPSRLAMECLFCHPPPKKRTDKAIDLLAGNSKSRRRPFPRKVTISLQCRERHPLPGSFAGRSSRLLIVV